MTRERKPCPDKPYKQMFIKEINGQRWFTLCQMNEDDYMNVSPVWQKLRRRKLQMNPVCEYCQSAINIQVHHLRYPEIWGEEQIEDLMTLCDECHRKVHGKDEYYVIPQSPKPENIPF